MKSRFELESYITKLAVYCYECKASTKKEENRVIKCMVNKYDPKTKTSTAPLFITVFTNKNTDFGSLDKDSLNKKRLYISGTFVVGEYNGKPDIKIFADAVRECNNGNQTTNAFRMC